MAKRTIIVSNIPANISAEDVETIFSAIGPIQHFSIQTIGDTQTSRIDYESEADAQSADALNNFEMDKLVLRVVIVETIETTSEEKEQKVDVVVQRNAEPSQEEKDFNPAADQVQRSVYVGNLAPGLTPDDLKVFFSKCGEVLVARINDGPTGRFGFLEFDSVEAANTAYRLHGTLFAERNIAVRTSNNSIMKTELEQEYIRLKLLVKKGLRTEEEIRRFYPDIQIERKTEVTNAYVDHLRDLISAQAKALEVSLKRRATQRTEVAVALLTDKDGKSSTKERREQRDRGERSHRSEHHDRERDYHRR